MNLDSDYSIVVIRLAIAAVLGAAIGFERSFKGRPAGLRTHMLVASASSLLMLLTVFQWDLLAEVPIDTLRVDPTRMAQGIMTGIGFLGAGVIMKERLAIRGLTTATSIWMTSAIGIIAGMGFYFAAAAATLLTLIILSIFGWFEDKVPTYMYSRLTIRSKRQEAINKDSLYQLIHEHGFKTSLPSYHLQDEGHYIEYQLTAHTKNQNNLQELAETLSNNPNIIEFSIIPVGR